MDDDEVQELLLSLKSDNEKWQEWFELEIEAVLDCSKIPEDLSSKVFKVQQTETTEPYGYFANVRLATFHDAENAEAESVADLMAATMVLINYCPFCGSKL